MTSQVLGMNIAASRELAAVLQHWERDSEAIVGEIEQAEKLSELATGVSSLLGEIGDDGRAAANALVHAADTLESFTLQVDSCFTLDHAVASLRAFDGGDNDPEFDVRWHNLHALVEQATTTDDETALVMGQLLSPSYPLDVRFADLSQVESIRSELARLTALEITGAISTNDPRIDGALADLRAAVQAHTNDPVLATAMFHALVTDTAKTDTRVLLSSFLTGVDAVALPAGSTSAAFAIPVWPGYGSTRIQFFIDDDRVCLTDVIAPIQCGHGDDRGFASGAEIMDYELPARVRVVLDHEVGQAIVVAYASHLGDEEETALPIKLEVDPALYGLPPDFPSSLRVLSHGEGIDGHIVFDYRFLNSATPEVLGGVSPAILGDVRVRQGDTGQVLINGSFGQYPSVEIIRDGLGVPGSLDPSRLLFTKQQNSGGPLNLFLGREEFSVQG